MEKHYCVIPEAGKIVYCLCFSGKDFELTIKRPVFSLSFYQKVPDKFLTLRLNFLIFKMKYMIPIYFVESIRS